MPASPSPFQTQCILSRTIQLRVRRKEDSNQGLYEDSRPLEEPDGGRVSEAYLISVNADDGRRVEAELKREYPGIETFDMERLHSQLASDHPDSKPEVSFKLQEQTRPENEVNSSDGGKKDINQNTTRMPAQPNGKLPAMEEDPSEEEQDRIARLRAYEDELRKRKELEKHAQRETEFLRSSLRGSKKLQALENMREEKKKEVEGKLNPAYAHEPHHMEEATMSGLPQTADLDAIMVSVDRVTEAMQRMPEHRSDANFIKDLFTQDPVRNAVDVTSRVQEEWSSKAPSYPTTSESFQTADGVLRNLEDGISSEAAELQNILEKPHLQATLFTHDRIVDRLHNVEPVASTSGKGVEHTPSSLGMKETVMDGSPEAGNLRLIKFVKAEDTYLGATVKNEGEKIVIGRLVKGGVAEKTRLLKEGDELWEVNGTDLRGMTVNQVCDLMRTMTGELNFIIKPQDENASDSGHVQTQLDHYPLIRHMRALFDYEPEDDFYVPCRELALKFQKGDVLNILSMEDPNWWQAYREGDEPGMHTLAGLVPSASFQIQREQYRREMSGENKKNQQHRDSTDAETGGFICTKRSKSKKLSKKANSKTTHFGTQNGMIGGRGVKDTNTDESAADDIPTYEEVALHLARTDRKRPVVLVGPPNVGCLELRQRLMESDPDKFSGIVPHTSRPRRPPEEDGVHYHFVGKQKFQEDVAAGRFVEWGEFERHCYGTSLSAIRQVVERGSVCVLTLKAQSLKALRTSNLMPYVIFVCPRSLERLKINRIKNTGTQAVKETDLKIIMEEAKRLEEEYGHYFDKTIYNGDLEQSFQELRDTVYRLETEPQWVPASWLNYDNNNGYPSP